MDHETPLRDLQRTDDAEAAPPAPLKRRWVFFYRGVGGAAVGLATAGVFLPLLPTTPFLLVAVWAFARGSPSTARWLREHRTFGPLIVSWEERGAIPGKAKAAAVVAMGGSWTGLALTSQSVVAIGSVGAVLACVAGFILTRPSR